MTIRLYPAEYVFPGHPDKLCDAIADALVEEAARREQRALVGVEVAVHRNNVYVTGRIACHEAETIDVEGICREVFASAGYDNNWYPAPADLVVHADLCLGPLVDGEADVRGMADDQSIVTGYAVNLPGTNYLPPEDWLAWRCSKSLAGLRTTRPDLQLGPDGKVEVIFEDQGDASRLVAISTSLQQRVAGNSIELHRAVVEAIEAELPAAAETIPGFQARVPDEVVVNGAGNFAEGGPEGDNGLSGKKLVVDAYGPRVPIGGGALSGKDFYKADRAGAIIARRLARAVVLTGVARECTATLSFFPGDERARLLRLENEAGEEVCRATWKNLLDLSLVNVGDTYGRPDDLIKVARYGHFLVADLPWEPLGFDNNEPVCDQV